MEREDLKYDDDFDALNDETFGNDDGMEYKWGQEHDPLFSKPTISNIEKVVFDENDEDKNDYNYADEDSGYINVESISRLVLDDDEDEGDINGCNWSAQRFSNPFLPPQVMSKNISFLAEKDAGSSLFDSSVWSMKPNDVAESGRIHQHQPSSHSQQIPVPNQKHIKTLSEVEEELFNSCQQNQQPTLPIHLPYLPQISPEKRPMVAIRPNFSPFMHPPFPQPFSNQQNINMVQLPNMHQMRQNFPQFQHRPSYRNEEQMGRAGYQYRDLEIFTDKDRQRMRNIQILQMQNDHPYSKDYYFQLKRYGETGEPKYLERIFTSKDDLAKAPYQPTRFDSALGKLKAVSALAPRKIFDTYLKLESPVTSPRLEILFRIESLCHDMRLIKEATLRFKASFGEEDEKKLEESRHFFTNDMMRIFEASDLCNWVYISKGRKMIGLLIDLLFEKNDWTREFAYKIFAYFLSAFDSSSASLMNQDKENESIFAPLVLKLVLNSTLPQLDLILQGLRDVVIWHSSFGVTLMMLILPEVEKRNAYKYLPKLSSTRAVYKERGIRTFFDAPDKANRYYGFAKLPHLLYYFVYRGGIVKKPYSSVPLDIPSFHKFLKKSRAYNAHFDEKKEDRFCDLNSWLSEVAQIVNH